MSRKQVNYELNQPNLTPANVRQGNYNVAVAGVGKSKTLELAQNLSQISPLLKQYANVQQDIGIKQAAGVEDKDIFNELKKEDPQAFLTFNRQKAYRNALYKRALNYEILPSLSNDAGELLNLDEFGAETDQFLEKRINPYLDQKWSEFSEKIGTYAEDPAAQALWIATTSEWRQQMVNNYNKSVDDFNVSSQEQELGLQLDATFKRSVDPTTGDIIKTDFSLVPDMMSQRDKLLSESGVSKPTARTKIMADAVVAQMDSLIQAGRYNDAQMLAQTVRSTRINGKPVFRTEAGAGIVTKLKEIDNATVEKDATVTAAERRSFTAINVSAIEGLVAVETIEDITDNTRFFIADTLRALEPDITDERLNEIYQEIADSPNPVIAFRELVQTTAIEAGDAGRDLFAQTKLATNEAISRAQVKPVAPALMTEERKAKALADFEIWKKDNPRSSAKQWITATGQNILSFEALKQRDKELSRGNYIFDNEEFKNSNNFLKNQLKAQDRVLNEGVSRDEEVDSLGFYDRSFGILRNELIEYAREIADEPDREELFRIFLRERATKLSETYYDAQEAVRSTSNLLRLDVPEASMQDIREADKKTKGAGTVKYTHLGRDNFPIATINNERNTAVRRNDIFQLGRSLIEFGFFEWDPKSYELLETAGLGVDDVRLFPNETTLQNTVAAWESVLAKSTQLQDLTPEEEILKDQYQDFGILNFNDLNYFKTTQSTFFGADND